jgi:hypothetical protein
MRQQHTCQRKGRLPKFPLFIERLPIAYTAEGGDPVPQQLLGAKIVRLGTMHYRSGQGAESGGFAIEYIPADSTQTRRIVFGFSEQGLWVYSDDLLVT